MYASERVQAMVEQLCRQNPFYGREGLPDPPRPDESSIPRGIPSLEQIPFIQRQLDILTYNHLPHTFFNLEKHRALQSILMTGKEALAEALPIRCLEATFVGLYLTQENKDLDRVPLSFRSTVEGNFYQHIVLVVHVRHPRPLYGALGLSRKRTLMYKPLVYRSLYDLIMDYKREYEALGHELIDIKLGLNVSHDPNSRLLPCWRFIAVKLAAFDEGSVAVASTAASTAAAPGAPASAAPPATPRSPLFPSGGVAVLPSEPICETSPSVATAEKALGQDESPNTARTAAREAMPPLAQLLAKYSRLLPVMTEQYYKGLPVVDGTNRSAKLCFMSLEEADRDAKLENTRRLELISKLQSPLSLEARKAASSRQLKSDKRSTQSHSHAGGGGGRSGVKRPATLAAAVPSRGVTAGPRGSPRTAAGASGALANFGATAAGGGGRPRPVDGAMSGEGALESGARATGPEPVHLDSSPLSVLALPPPPRSESMRFSSISSFSGCHSSSLSDDGFLTDRCRTEGGS